MALHLRTIAAAVVLSLGGLSGSALAQTTFEQGNGIVFGTIGFQSDMGGTVNSSGIGVVNGARAEINSNTWGERYDAALIFRIGGAYNVTDRSQVFAAINWEQSEADTAVVGLLAGQPLEAKFGDYQGWGMDFGYRYLFPRPSGPVPFVSGAIGFQNVDEIDVSLSAATPRFVATDVPFYDDSFVASWRIGTGFLWDINPRFGIQFTIDIKYAGVLSDAAGIGTIGFERINDTGNRWTIPYSGGVYYKF
jgi:hypothetical protein